MIRKAMIRLKQKIGTFEGRNSEREDGSEVIIQNITETKR